MGRFKNVTQRDFCAEIEVFRQESGRIWYIKFLIAETGKRQTKDGRRLKKRSSEILGVKIN